MLLLWWNICDYIRRWTKWRIHVFDGQSLPLSSPSDWLCMCKLLLLSFISMLLIMEVLWIKHCFWTERPLFGEKPEFNVRGWWAIQSSSVDHWPAEIKTAFRRPLGDICSFRGDRTGFRFWAGNWTHQFYVRLKICWATVRSQIGSKSTRGPLDRVSF